MRAYKNELRTGAANFATSIIVGSTAITNSATTLNRSHVCCIFGSTGALVSPATKGSFGAELRSPVGGSFQSWGVIL